MLTAVEHGSVSPCGNLLDQGFLVWSGLVAAMLALAGTAGV